jgi:hypothetical protein
MECHTRKLYATKTSVGLEKKIKLFFTQNIIKSHYSTTLNPTSNVSIKAGLVVNLSFVFAGVFLFINVLKCKKAMLSGSTVTTAWRVLGLRIEDTASRYGG